MSKEFEIAMELLRTAAAVAVPFVLVWAGHALQRRQKFFEAVMTEKVRHYTVLSPLLNLIFSYRMRVGDFLERTPESVLDAKRRADQEFWTFEYLWSADFRAAYHDFMNAAFKAFNEEGTKALIRVDGNVHPVKPTTTGWPAFTGEAVDRKAWGAVYGRLKAAIARDLGFVEFCTKVDGIGG
jgi:hypothetical protein